jgi:hypothetical protein
MTPYPGAVRIGALTLLVCAAATAPADAAWNNAFQVCCHNCRSNVSNYPAVPCPQPCPPPCPPQQQCVTRYEQRCYYQPITTYKTSYYYEPVTTYKTSYYYEPVTTYRYSCYYDPCTGCPKQVCVPCTSYQLRSQCCPVTSYLQRCQVTPCTTYQQMFYYIPRTTCCTTTEGAPIFGTPPAGAGVGAVPHNGGNPPVVGEGVGPQPGFGAPPNVGENRTTQPPNVGENRQPIPGMENSMKVSPQGAPRQPRLGPPEPAARPTPPPDVRIDKVVSLARQEVEGVVVNDTRQPFQGVEVVFVNAANERVHESVRSDADGSFRVKLTEGRWLVYVETRNGQVDFAKEIEVGNGNTPALTLVKR